jgi:hypothetical protein
MLRVGSTAILLALSALALASGAGAASSEPVCGTPAAIFCDDFENETLPGIWGDGYDPARHTIISSPAANVYRGARALQALYPAGGDGGWLTHWFTPSGAPPGSARAGYDHVFARLYWKLDPAWRCESSASCGKVMVLYGTQTGTNGPFNPWSGFGKAGVCPSGSDYFNAGSATLQPPPQEMILYTYYPDMPCPGFGQYFRTGVGLVPGTWTCIEQEILVNTPGQRNGLQRLWVDGTLVGEVLNMRWRDTTNIQTTAFQLSFSLSPPQSQRAWVDNVVVSTQRVGCLSAGAAPAAPSGLTVQ